MEDRINGARYLNFLDNRLHILLEDIPLHTRRHMWYQLDGAPAHFTRPVCQRLHQHFPARWIGRGGSVSWPP
ncbi:hypothetical protein X777_03908 [Ooceraea biroi]|uniref:Tc1-like transposase DDE domain-containing protein n=1 Tax=Ooceraea biroi TaxID=2015173 RepID=A0A026VV14_OOCBI|nr:hypothetical protein X777_03908 [Ooceraea biroi]